MLKLLELMTATPPVSAASAVRLTSSLRERSPSSIVSAVRPNVGSSSPPAKVPPPRALLAGVTLNFATAPAVERPRMSIVLIATPDLTALSFNRLNICVTSVMIEPLRLRSLKGRPPETRTRFLWPGI